MLMPAAVSTLIQYCAIGGRTAMHRHITAFAPSLYFSKSIRAGTRAMYRILKGLGHRIVALDEEGRPRFSLLQDRTGIRTGRVAGSKKPGPSAPIVFQAFDLLHLDGRSLLDVPLEERKRLLRSRLRIGLAAHPVDARRIGGYVIEQLAAGHDLLGLRERVGVGLGVGAAAVRHGDAADRFC